jgi:hypothetical protein
MIEGNPIEWISYNITVICPPTSYCKHPHKQVAEFENIISQRRAQAFPPPLKK